MDLKEVIQKYLDENNHNWSWLSDNTGISREIIYGIKKRTQRNITLRNLIKIDEHLHMDLNEFKEVTFK